MYRLLEPKERVVLSDEYWSFSKTWVLFEKDDIEVGRPLDKSAGPVRRLISENPRERVHMISAEAHDILRHVTKPLIDTSKNMAPIL